MLEMGGQEIQTCQVHAPFRKRGQHGRVAAASSLIRASFESLDTGTHFMSALLDGGGWSRADVRQYRMRVRGFRSRVHLARTSAGPPFRSPGAPRPRAVIPCAQARCSRRYLDDRPIGSTQPVKSNLNQARFVLARSPLFTNRPGAQLAPAQVRPPGYKEFRLPNLPRGRFAHAAFAESLSRASFATAAASRSAGTPFRFLWNAID